jgi:hypothetical protein
MSHPFYNRPAILVTQHWSFEATFESTKYFILLESMNRYYVYYAECQLEIEDFLFGITTLLLTLRVAHYLVPLGQ